jgi:hypothetical protein
MPSSVPTISGNADSSRMFVTLAGMYDRKFSRNGFFMFCCRTVERRLFKYYLYVVSKMPAFRPRLVPRGLRRKCPGKEICKTCVNLQLMAKTRKLIAFEMQKHRTASPAFQRQMPSLTAGLLPLSRKFANHLNL